MSGEITDRHLLEISRYISSCWARLGIKLGVPNYRITALQKPPDVLQPDQYAAEVLEKWHNQMGCQLSVVEAQSHIAAALRRCGRTDVAEDVETNFQSEQDIHKVFHEISPRLTGRDYWKRLGRELNFSEIELDGIVVTAPPTQEPQFEMLNLWKLQTPKTERRTQLIAALEDLECLHIIKVIEEVDRKLQEREVGKESSRQPFHWSFSCPGPNNGEVEKQEAVPRDLPTALQDESIGFKRPVSTPRANQVRQTRTSTGYKRPCSMPGSSIVQQSKANTRTGLRRNPNMPGSSKDKQLKGKTSNEEKDKRTDQSSLRKDVPPYLAQPAPPTMPAAPGLRRNPNKASKVQQLKGKTTNEDKDKGGVNIQIKEREIEETCTPSDQPSPCQAEEPGEVEEKQEAVPRDLPTAPEDESIAESKELSLTDSIDDEPSNTLFSINTRSLIWQSLIQTQEARMKEDIRIYVNDPDEEEKKTSAELKNNSRWMTRFNDFRLRVGTSDGRPVVIALLDSGVFLGHPDLEGLVLESKTFIGEEEQGTCVPNEAAGDDLEVDIINHGTVSAGIIQKLTVGQNVKILNYKVVNHEKTSKLQNVVRALEQLKKWDKDHPDMPVDIVQMSFGKQQVHKEMDKLLSELGEEKVLIAAASNEGQWPGCDPSPAKHDKVISIGSCDDWCNTSRFSPIGKNVDFLLPGEKIWAASSQYKEEDENTRYIQVSGTSFAAPYCAALVALLLPFIEKTCGFEMRKGFTTSERTRMLISSISFKNDKGLSIPDLSLLTKDAIMKC